MQHQLFHIKRWPESMEMCKNTVGLLLEGKLSYIGAILLVWSSWHRFYCIQRTSLPAQNSGRRKRWGRSLLGVADAAI